MEKITHVVFDHDGTLVDTSGLRRFLYPGIKDLLETLSQNGIPMYVWTARGKASTEKILKELNAIKYFEDICGGDTATMKPSSEGLEYLLPDISPENVIVIGDSMGDIIGAKSFGARAMGALWAHRDERAVSHFLENGATDTFLTANDFREYILEYI